MNVVRHIRAVWVGASAAVLCAAGLCGTAAADDNDLAAAVLRDITYAVVDGHELKLDLYMPAGGGTGSEGDAAKPPLVVWVHGGAWRSGSRAKVPIEGLVQHGYAIASVDYRLSPVAPFPAQTHDIKAAIRFLRARAEEHGYDAERIGIAGSSAGGHLAALVGVTGGVEALEGPTNPNESPADVDAIIDLYGPTNFMTILPQSTPHGLSVRVPALELLLGGRPEDKPELAKLASPVFHVDASDPPLLIIHGDQDNQVPINQSHELHAAYKRHRLLVHFEVIHGGGHGGKEFYDAARLKLMRTFLDEHLRPANN